ncbi:MAG: type II toxin-antitoxin system RelE/ParE family toxin [Jiangellaceae bacterium]
MRWTVEFSEEVRTWYVGLSPAGKAAADRILERLEAQGHMLRMPHSRPLEDGLYELRFTCENVARRITYVFDRGRRAVTLTTFRKQRQNERAEILRARRAQAAHQKAREAEQRAKQAKKGRKR